MLKVLCIYALLFCFHSNVYSQNYTLQILDSSNTVIQNATLYDERNNIFIVTDLNGKIRLSAKSYNFLITHVSFVSKKIEIPYILKDTFITVRLENKQETLQTVIVSTKKIINKGKLIHYGYYASKKEAKIIFKNNVKFGMAFKNLHEEGFKNELISFQFKLTDLNEIIKKDFGILINIYEIKNDLIINNSLNKIPIFLESKNFKKNNLVKINEKILIPKEGFFISFQLSSSNENDNDIELTFPINLHLEKKIFFVENSLNPLWSNEKLSSRIGLIENNNYTYPIYSTLKLGIVYYKTKLKSDL